MNSQGLETAFINRLVAGFSRSPRSRTAPHESDAELIDIFLGGIPAAAPLLAVTTDTISEEIGTGLYQDPYLFGWMAVMANLSDLAAVGAEPVGLLISETFPDEYDDCAIDKIQAGIADACVAARTHVLGGDTNSGQALSITGTALGLVNDGRCLTRKGCAPGDVLYASGPLGRGNGFALSVWGNGRSESLPGGYRPRARIAEGIVLRGIASSCTDTSDGFLCALDQLLVVNAVGFNISERWEEKLDRSSLELVRSHGLPSWLLLAGCHGEFELIFTVSESRRKLFADAAASIGWSPIELGIVTGPTGVTLPVGGALRTIDVAHLRNLSFRLPGGIGKYVEALVEYDHQMVSGG